MGANKKPSRAVMASEDPATAATMLGSFNWISAASGDAPSANTTSRNAMTCSTVILVGTSGMAAGGFVVSSGVSAMISQNHDLCHKPQDPKTWAIVGNE